MLKPTRDTLSVFFVLGFVVASQPVLADTRNRPNVLVAISDDQSYPHASAYGYEALRTPAFDRVAKMGVLFQNAFTPAPGCSPMRAAFLTGRHVWQIEHAGTHASTFPAKYEGFQERLGTAGYFVGFTGKGWAPGNWKDTGRATNPAGPEFSKLTLRAPEGIRSTDYAANFAEFLRQRPKGKPFSFWYGASEPHRKFKKGIGREHGLDPAKIVVPGFLPDTPEIRDDILDYCYEVEWFDEHLGRMLNLLEEQGELDNTIVIVTSDNGMAFPRAKANVYEYGIHMPLAVAWPARVPAGRTIDDLVDLIDLTATLYEATGVRPPRRYPLSGRSLLGALTSSARGIVDSSRDAVFSGRERHSSSRFMTLGYPQRAVRTRDYLYIYNLRPERWPAGAPRKLGSANYPTPEAVLTGELGLEHGGYHDIDACPTLSFLIDNAADSTLGCFLRLAVGIRPAEELYDIRVDPACINNLAGAPEHSKAKQRLRSRLITHLTKTGDPRVVASDSGDIFETYPRYSKLRWFPTPAWAKGNPKRVPLLPWVEKRRPRIDGAPR